MQKDWPKSNAISRKTIPTTPSQSEKMFISFINSKFFSWLLTWMFTSEDCDKKINRIHERSLRLILNDYE